jgi:hypothetical protein
MGMLRKFRRKAGALRRRYGHFGMAEVNNAAAGVRKFASDNAPITAAVVGAAGGALAGGLGAGAGALVGAVAGVGIEEATKK